jgi:hypothetical protein
LILSEKQEIEMFYLNGTRTSRNKLETLYGTVVPFNLYVNSKLLAPFDMLKMIKINTKSAFKLFLASLFEPQISITERIMTINAAIYQCKRGTIANLVFIERISQILSNSDVLKILFTIEGHAHEALLINLVQEEFPDIKLIAYQHAPLLKTQFGFMENLKLMRPMDVLALSGIIPSNFVDQNIYRKENHLPECRIIGTSKFREASVARSPGLSLKKRFVLFLPEGTKDSLAFYLKTMKILAEQNPDLKFRLRAHPASNINAYKFKKIWASLPTNASISRDSLDDDFAGAFASVHRSSSASIEGLIYGITPIHFSENTRVDLDPFSISTFDNFHAENVFELSKMIRITFNESCNFSSLEFQKLASINLSFFSPLNYEGIISL